MKLKVIRELIRIAGSERVLMEPEDLYVYSYEKFFEQPKYSNLDVVVRPKSKAEIDEIMQLADREDFNVILRGKKTSPSKSNIAKSGTILLDIASLPNILSTLNERLSGMKERRQKMRDELEMEPGASFRNYFPALLQVRNLSIYQCQECDTCSGYCAVSPHFHHVETWSSKGRYLLIRGLMNGELKPSKKLIEILYSCTLCGLCYGQCFADLNINETVISARRYIADLGQTPEPFMIALKNVRNHGNVAGASLSSRMRWMEKLPRNLLKEKAHILYWVGCNTALRSRLRVIALAAVNVLDRAGVEVMTLGEKEGCCGVPFFFGGLFDDAKKNAESIIEIVEKSGAEILVTSCSGCYEAFTYYYPNLLDIEMPCEVLHTSQLLESLIKNEKLSFKELEMKVTYHDPCGLGRHCKVYDAPRAVLNAIPGLRLVEMPLNREHSRCCGGGGGLWGMNHIVSMDAAYTRIAEDVLPLNVEMLVTACPQCYLTFLYTSTHRSIKIRVGDITQMADIACTQSEVGGE